MKGFDGVRVPVVYGWRGYRVCGCTWTVGMRLDNVRLVPLADLSALVDDPAEFQEKLRDEVRDFLRGVDGPCHLP